MQFCQTRRELTREKREDTREHMTERENFDPSEIVRRVIESPMDEDTIEAYRSTRRDWNRRCALASYTDKLPLDEKMNYFNNIGKVYLRLVE